MKSGSTILWFSESNNKVKTQAEQAPLLLLLFYFLAATGLGCVSASGEATKQGPSLRAKERFASHRIQAALQLRSEGRHGAAERNLRRALAVHPESAKTLRLLARVLEEQDHWEEANQLRARANFIEPPPGEPAETAIPIPHADLAIYLISTKNEQSAPPSDFQVSDAEELLENHLSKRFPSATLHHFYPTSITEAKNRIEADAAKRVLSLRTVRRICGDNPKEGPFSYARLRASLVHPQESWITRRNYAEVEHWPPPNQPNCDRSVLLRSIENLLSEVALVNGLTVPVEKTEWSQASLRAVFPELGEKIQQHIERGRARLATGRLKAAGEAFQAALAIDPEDQRALQYAAETELTRTMLQEISLANQSSQQENVETGFLDPQLSQAQRQSAEQLLAEEERMRKHLLTALWAVEHPITPLPDFATQALVTTEIEQADPISLELATRQAKAELTLKSLFAPDGSLIARFFYAGNSTTPLLEARDTNGDQKEDRWVGFRAGKPHEIWEDRQATQQPDVHWTLAADGVQIEKIEVDHDQLPGFEQAFEYRAGRLVHSSMDRDGDGRFDQFERFDENGKVTERNEDLNGDGSIDVRSFFQNGALIRREISDPAALEELERRSNEAH